MGTYVLFCLKDLWKADVSPIFVECLFQILSLIL